MNPAVSCTHPSPHRSKSRYRKTNSLCCCHDKCTSPIAIPSVSCVNSQRMFRLPHASLARVPLQSSKSMPSHIPA